GLRRLLLVSWVRDSLTKSCQLGEDLVSGFRPDKGPRRFVGDRKILANRCFERADASVGAALDLLLAQEREPPFDQIEPGRAGGCEVDVKTWMTGGPPVEAGGYVGYVIIVVEMEC